MNGPTELQEAQSNAQMWKDRHTLAERRLAATVDELTEAQTENARLAALIMEAFDQRDAAQATRGQAEAQRDRALEQLAESRTKLEKIRVCERDWRYVAPGVCDELRATLGGYE